MKKPLIRSMSDVFKHVTPGSRPLCLFSGGLDGAYLLARLKEIEGVTPYALTVDLGGEDDIKNAKKVADQLGAELIMLNKVSEFCENFVLPAIRAQAIYLGTHPISSSLSRPLLAQTAVTLAKELGCDVILHTANPSQNSLRRFNGALDGLNFEGIFGSPYETTPVSREEKARFLASLGVHVFKTRPYSVDTNIWCREFESGDLDNPESFPWPEAMFEWTKNHGEPKAESLTIDFEKGVPVRLNGRETELRSMIQKLNQMAGKFMLGRYASLEEIEGGTKFQEIREMPAACLLLDAYRRVESACVSAECIREKMHNEQLWVREAIEGRWFHPLKMSIDAFIGQMAGHVTGTIEYDLTLRCMRVVSIRAKKPVYHDSRERFEEELNRGNGSSSDSLKKAA